MKLKKPIVFFDIESTGLDTRKDRIVELCMIKVTETPEGRVKEVRTKRFNPMIPISAGATETHGITNEDVSGYPSFKAFSKGILEFIDGCDLAGFNSNRFDIPMLYNEFKRSGINWEWKKHLFLDASTMYRRTHPNTLSAVYKHYTLKELEDAHAAEADVEATIEVFFSMMDTESEVAEMTAEELASYCNYDREIVDINGHFVKDEEGMIVFNFGQHKGKRASTELGFLQWMTKKDFPDDAKNICIRVLGGHL